MSNEATNVVTTLEDITRIIQEKEYLLSNKKEHIISLINKLYICQYRHNALWLYDYYDMIIDRKMNNADRHEASGLVIVVYYNDKKFKAIHNNTHSEEVQKALYRDFFKIVQVLNECEVCDKHNECLKNKIVNKLTEVITPDQIKKREDAHIENINRYIIDVLKLIANSLYSTADNGDKKLRISFSTLTEKYVTNNDNIPIYYKHPNADGVTRSKFIDYLYYLFEKENPKSDDEQMISEIEWIASVMIKKIKQIFPHIKFYYRWDEKCTLPDIIAEIDVEINLLL